MISFRLNGETITYLGDESISLLSFIREEKDLVAAKDGCSGQAACGACTVEINGKPTLSCVTPLKKLHNAEVFTLEGIPDPIKNEIARVMVEKGAVQCGFCTPGFIMRIRNLLQTNPNPNLDQIRASMKSHLCRCTGYKKIEESVLELSKGVSRPPITTAANVGNFYPKYEAYETALGQRRFVNDLKFNNMLFGALKFSDYPRAKVLSIDYSEALKLEGVIKVFTAKDVPGKRNTGLIYDDWPLMIAPGEITNYIGDVLAGVVAKTEKAARLAASLIKVDYEVLEAVTDVHTALKKDAIQVHNHHANLLDSCILKKGDADGAIKSSAFVATGSYQTQRIEHAFMETESAVAMPEAEGILLYSSGQGIYEDRRQLASLLGIAETNVRVILVPNGGGFGGKEDLSVQGHAALFAFTLKQVVKVTLSRPESIRMHPKRHPVWMDITLSCDLNGKLTALKLRAIGDTGAYASVGTKVMERVAGHATGGYYVPAIDLEALTVYTNNIPSGAMRGFGANQVAFALEGCMDELCKKGGFDPWQFRYDNALVDGLTTATGQKVQGAGIRACLDALKPFYLNATFSGLACGIKNSGIGNGMIDYSDVIIEIESETKIVLHQGWTEMGQGIYTMAIQFLCHETGLDPELIEVKTDTASGIKTGMTTSSRATVLLGNAIKEACIPFKEDLKNHALSALVGKKYQARWQFDQSTKPGDLTKESITHYSYGYAAQLVVLDKQGNIEKVVAAHDAGKIINPVFYEGQVEGAVHMGLGYALTEDLEMENGLLMSVKLKDCRILKAHETPEIKVLPVEVADPIGPYGAKGLGEIGLVPTAAAVANALCNYDGIRRYKLPLKRTK